MLLMRVRSLPSRSEIPQGSSVLAVLRSGWAQHQRALAGARHHHAGRADELVQHQLPLHFENAKRRTMQMQTVTFS